MKRNHVWQKFLALAVVFTMMTGLLPMQSLAVDHTVPQDDDSVQCDFPVRVPSKTRNGGTITQISRNEYNVTLAGQDSVVIYTDQSNLCVRDRWNTDNDDVAYARTLSERGFARVKFTGETGDVVISYCELVGRVPHRHFETTDHFLFHVNKVEDTVLTYETNGGFPMRPETYAYGTVVELNRGTVRAGYQFTGWYSDPECTNKITSIEMNGDQTVYAGWALPKIPELLNSISHNSYADGYPDGTIRPNSDITRAEVSTMLYSLLKDCVREAYKTEENDFSDVNEDQWFNVYVSTLAKLGALSGYPDGTFAPDKPMTRAEFTTMMVALDPDEPTVEALFSDTEDHWAEAAISKAALNGWVAGYPDGTFQPDKSITRAEVFAILNSMLGRQPAGVDSLLDGMRVWPDNMDTSAWYYLDIQEATNSHNYILHCDRTEDWVRLK